PCPTAPAIMIDTYGTGVGLASETAKNKNYQARIMWIDATANIDRYNTEAKIVALVQRIKDSGFNTIVFDIKPISGQTVYPSSLAPKLTEWRGQKLPADFDPVPLMTRECHAKGLSIFASMNAFSEGHRMFKVGPGYSEPEHQTVLYQAQPVLKTARASYPLSLTLGSPPGGLSIAPSIASLPRRQQRSGYLTVLGPDLRVTFSGYPVAAPADLKGTILFGVGDAVDFMKQNLAVGTQVSYDTEPRYVHIGDLPNGQIPLMMNPNDPTVQDHALAMIREVVSKYDLDGVVYDDRLRYAGIDGDFSELTRQKFEAAVGKKLDWPDDVFKFTLNSNLSRGILPGPYYDQWMSWRAKQIQDYVLRVRQTVTSARPSALLGVYVGSWYGDYPALGHNYASPDSRAGFWFDDPGYKAAGTAGLVDFLIAGCYYSTATVYDAMRKGVGIGSTVEAAGSLCNRLVRDETWSYAGIDCGPFAKDPQGLCDALQAACASTQGVMVFDLSHDTDTLWPVFAKVFSKPMVAPHQVPGSTAALRAHRKLVDTFHQPERPVIIAAGSSGVGQ
ncbi:MAG TPA: family 10 glycosylhydrolase, partial [Fimbriimonas sp.]|nr:family 10 glycosylhydrolase [Fimbriimonas sp.]